MTNAEVLMRRVRLFIVLGLAGATAGVIGSNITARTAEPASALPPQAALLPADATFVMGVDLRRLVESPLYKRFGSGPLESRKEAWAELERRTGVDPEKDLTHMIAAGSGRSDASGVALLLGRFERTKVEAALTRASTADGAREHAGRKLWLFEPKPGQKAQAVAVLDDGVMAAGSPAEVEAAIDRQKSKEPGLTGNATLVALAAKIDPASTFWMCGDQGLLSTVGGASPQTAGWTIPSVKTFVASGDLDPDVVASIVAQTTDDAAAKSVSDMLRGLLAMVTMQAGQQPALKELASGIAIEQQGPEVKIAARFSYDTLAKLSTPAPAPTATPAPPAPPAPAPRKQPRKN
jgi:hypothetical protein